MSSHDDRAGGKRQPRKWLFCLTAMLLTVASLILVALNVAPAHVTAAARATTWTQIWSDEFNGAAGTGVNPSNWQYDLGTGFGTGEIETMTNRTSNVHQDGAGHLLITALRDANGNWTSGRIETRRSDFGAPAGVRWLWRPRSNSPTLRVRQQMGTGQPSGCLVHPSEWTTTGPKMVKSISWRISMG